MGVMRIISKGKLFGKLMGKLITVLLVKIPLNLKKAVKMD